MKTKNKQKPLDKTVRVDIKETLDNVFPGNLIKMPRNFDGSYFAKVREALRGKLYNIDGLDVLYERDWRGKDSQTFIANPAEEGDFFGDCAYSDESPASYHVFFVGLADKKFLYMCEIDPNAEGAGYDDDEEDGESLLKDSPMGDIVPGEGVVGCTIGISMFAPYAIIKPDSMEFYNDRSQTLPDIGIDFLDLGQGEVKRDSEDNISFFIEESGEEVSDALTGLSAKIASILETSGIQVIPDDEWKKPLPWLKTDSGLNRAKPISVRNALFIPGEY